MKKPIVYLDTNILVDTYLDGEIISLLRKIKNKFKLVASELCVYEAIFVLLKHEVSTYLVKESIIPISKVVKLWRQPQRLFREIEKQTLKEFIEKVNKELFKILEDLEVEIIEEKVEENIILPLLYLGIHLEDALHLAIAIQLDSDYFLTKDSGILENKKILEEQFGIKIINGEKETLNKLIID